MSLRVERSNLYKLDCHDFLQSLAHAVRLTLCALATAMTVKNNFSILNLVKSFLTLIKFNFYNLSIENKNINLDIKNLKVIKEYKGFIYA